MRLFGRRQRAALAVVAVVGTVATAAGCTSTVAGRGSPAPVSPAALCRPTGSVRSGPADRPRTDAARLVDCLRAEVDRMWTAQVGRPVWLAVLVDPPAAQVAGDCGDFLAFGTAFYCPSDGRVYITAAAVARDRSEFGSALPYALATTVAHEVGHRVQDVLHEAGLDATDDAGSRRVEQQADCLGGVWAGRMARRGRLDPALYRRVLRRELELISALRPPPGSGLSSYDEVRTHGTVPQRLAAFDRGYRRADPTDCGLSVR